MGDVFKDPRGVDSRGYYMGSMNGQTQYGDVIGAGLVSDFNEAPKVLAADLNRHSLSTNEWMSEFFNSSSIPVGHGFTQSNIDANFASYSFEPKSNLPLKVIVFDDTQSENDFNVNEHGYVDNKSFDWLINELDKGQSEGKLMIISAHIPVYLIGYASHSPVSKEKLIAKLQTYPNLILWISGHLHKNKVVAYKSPDINHPEFGFWHVETASIKDFPQQFRTFNIVLNDDNTISIFAVNVNPAFSAGSLGETAFFYSVASIQIFFPDLNLISSGAYNAELLKKLSPEMQIKLQQYKSKLIK